MFSDMLASPGPKLDVIGPWLNFLSGSGELDLVISSLLQALNWPESACQVPSLLAGEEWLHPGATWCQAEL